MCNNVLHETNYDKRKVNFRTQARKQVNWTGYSNTYLFKEVELGKTGDNLHLPTITFWMARMFMAIA